MKELIQKMFGQIKTQEELEKTAKSVVEQVEKTLPIKRELFLDDDDIGFC